MMTIAAVERCLDEGREALVLLAELVAKGNRSRTEIFLRTRAEHDALVCLLEEAPESEHDRIRDLIRYYETMMRSLRN